MTTSTEYPAVPVPRIFSWSGIFAGTFLFLAIEATFGILGMKIFASARPGIGVGFGIWMVVLSIISLYFAGRLAGRLTGATTQNLGMYAGLVTFGMSIFTSVLLMVFALGNTVSRGTDIAASVTRMGDLLASSGYWLFVALVLAMISAALGGIHGAAMSGLRLKSKSSALEAKRAA